MAGQITAIQAQKKNQQRANIFLDGEFAFGLALIEAAKLSKGQYLSDEDIAALRMADEQARAYEFALDFLSYRPRSSAEVDRRLRKKEFCESTIEHTVQRLSRAGLIDDEEFARYWISNREQFKPRGARALRYELHQKGIAERIIDDLVQDVDELESAYRAMSPKLAQWQHLDSSTFRRKLTGHLQRRGFNYAVISQVWERIQAEREHQIDKREDMETWEQET
ncbi:MAG: RecX family transcriptional regulator [Anaerolineae bacterium]|nr:RecX family transcriptional regulator [Anaerolineae bacterium]